MTQGYHPYGAPQAPQAPAQAQPAQQPTYLAQAPHAAAQPGIDYESLMPSDAMVAEAHQHVQETRAKIERAKGGGGGSSKWLDFPGPNGTKFSQAPVGYEIGFWLYFCPGWAPGAPYFAEDWNHFFHPARKPQGDSCGCAKENCYVCAAKDYLYKQGGEANAKLAQKGRNRKQYVYQVMLPQHFQSHFTDEGKLESYKLRISLSLHEQIQQVIQIKRAHAVLHPQYGRPFYLSKKRTGPEKFDVKWTLNEGDPAPWPQEFLPLLENLDDLSAFAKAPTLSLQHEALVSYGFPVPPELPGLVQQEQAQEQAQAQPPQQIQQGYGQQPPQQIQQGYGQPAYTPQGMPPNNNPWQR